MTFHIATALSTRTATSVSPLVQQAIHLLRMNNQDLAAHLEQVAQDNPFLEVRRPVPAPRSQRLSDDSGADTVERVAAPTGVSLYVHVAAEIRRLFDIEADQRDAAKIAEHLAPTGWLATPVAQIAAETGLSPSRVDALVAGLQRMEPAGLFARSLSECLQLQARAEGALTPVMAVVLDNLPLLAAAKLGPLATLARTTPEGLAAALRRLRSYNPKPGTLFDADEAPQRGPDVIVTRQGGDWHVELNRSTLPSLSVRGIEGMAQRDALLGGYIGERLAAARWLSRAIAHRNVTTLKVTHEVMRRQSAFLDHGQSHLRPLTLAEVAESVGVHESTVSRVTQDLLVQTPQGTLPLKQFFSAALASTDGSDAGSAAAIRHRIAQLVSAESPSDPLSDDALAEIITREGTQLARRTVAKYRKQLRIASSFERRRRATIENLH